jgi:Crp-like helix-turn-helix protein
MAQELLLLLGDRSAEQRVLGFLASWQKRCASIGAVSEFVPLPMQRTDIADLLGLTLETVSRAFAKLEAKEVIRTVPNGVIFKGVQKVHPEGTAPHEPLPRTAKCARGVSASVGHAIATNPEHSRYVRLGTTPKRCSGRDDVIKPVMHRDK